MTQDLLGGVDPVLAKNRSSTNVFLTLLLLLFHCLYEAMSKFIRGLVGTEWQLHERHRAPSYMNDGII